MTLGHIGKTDIVMHPAMPVLVMVLYLSPSRSMIGVMLITLLLHEAAHALCAYLLGLHISQVELMPFGGAVRLEGWCALEGWRGALISASGPLANLLVVMVCASLVQAGLFHPSQLSIWVKCNLSLMLLNLIPALPLDGGRIVCAILGYNYSPFTVRKILSLMGCVLAILLLTLGVWSASQGVINLTIFLMGSYLFYAAIQESRIPTYQMVENLSSTRHHIQRYGTIGVRTTMVYQTLPVYKLAARLNNRDYHEIQVVDEHLRNIGMLGEAQLVQAMIQNPTQTIRSALEHHAKSTTP